MQHFSRYGWWSAALLAMVLLAVASRPGTDELAASTRPIDDWSIVELVEHLNRMGVDVRLRSTQANGVFHQNVFLTTTDRDWQSLNFLNKDAKRIHEWRGVLHCERLAPSESVRALHLMGDRCLVIGPFLFYGDAELLRLVRVALAPVASPTAP